MIGGEIPHSLESLFQVHKKVNLPGAGATIKAQDPSTKGRKNSSVLIKSAAKNIGNRIQFKIIMNEFQYTS